MNCSSEPNARCSPDKPLFLGQKVTNRQNSGMASDLDIYRTAKVVIDGHGGSALYLAHSRLDDCRDRGDREGAETWRRIIAAIEALQAQERPDDVPLN